MAINCNSTSNFFHTNIEVLALINERLSLSIKNNHFPSDSVTIENTKKGNYSLRYNNIAIHSLYDPEKEACRFIEKHNIVENTAVLLFGFGLGYHVKQILERIGPKGRVFVVEPNLEILRAAFAVVDLSEIISDGRLFIISGESQEKIALRLRSMLDRKLIDSALDINNIIVHEPSFKAMPDGFDKLKNTFEILLIERRAPQFFEKVNSCNFLKNLDVVLKSPGIASLFNKFKEYPAFFINAGPSLDRALVRLKKYRKRAIYFACDTALPALIDIGIHPDFVFSVDPQDESKKHFIGYFDSSATLIYMPTSASSIVENYKGQRMVFLHKNHSLTGQFEGLLGFKGFTTAGSSVSCMGLDILVKMGCKKVVLVGMDYSFPGGKVYSSNVAATKSWLPAINKFDTAEKYHWQAITKHKLISVENKFSDKLLTYQTLYSYKKQIEGLIHESYGVDFYSYLSHGAYIEGAEDVCFEEDLLSILDKDIEFGFDFKEHALDSEIKTKILQSFK